MAPEPCLSVPCPLCRAFAGEPCHEMTWERLPRRPHNRRRWAYRRERPQVVVDCGAYVGGFVGIGSGARIGSFARIGELAVIGPGVKIEQGARVPGS